MYLAVKNQPNMHRVFFEYSPINLGLTINKDSLHDLFYFRYKRFLDNIFTQTAAYAEMCEDMWMVAQEVIKRQVGVEMQAGKFRLEQDGINKINDLIERARIEIFTSMHRNNLGARIRKFLNTLVYICPTYFSLRIFLTYNGEPYYLNVNKDDFAGLNTGFVGDRPTNDQLWEYMYRVTLDEIWKK